MAEILFGIESARFYIARGFYVVPAPLGEKGSRTPGWQNLRLGNTPELELYFGHARQNVGALLGEPRGLCDVDRDAPEAHWAWKELGIESGFVFGRRSNPESHSFFYAQPPLKTTPYDDPSPGERKKRLIELRASGYQLLPPSQHPSGEPYEFVHSGDPTSIDARVLEAAVRHSAAAILVARHLKEGARHHGFLALAGALARAGWHREQTENLLHAVYRILWREAAKLDAADREANDSYDEWEQGRKTTGLPTLRNLLDGKVFDKLAEWLRFDTKEPPPQLEPLWTGAPNGGAGAAAPAPARAPAPEDPEEPRMPAPYLIGSLRDQPLVQPVDLVHDWIKRPSFMTVTGMGKSGKTVLVNLLGMCVATGQPFLGRDVLQTPVLFLEWDDPQGKHGFKDFEARCRASVPGMPFHCITPKDRKEKPNFGHPHFWSDLKDLIRDRRIGLVIFDAYKDFRAPRARKADPVEAETEELNQLADVGTQMDCAVLLNHHDSKTAVSSRLHWSQLGAGTYAMQANPFGAIHITRYPELPEGDPFRLVAVEGRRLNGGLFTLRFLKESLDYDLVLEGGGAEIFPHLIELHREFRGVPISAQECVRTFGWSKSSTYRYLDRLCHSSPRILEKSSGGYRWADEKFNLKGVL